MGSPRASSASFCWWSAGCWDGASVPIPKFACASGTLCANFGIEGTPASLRSQWGFGFEVPLRALRNCWRNFKSATLGHKRSRGAAERDRIDHLVAREWLAQAGRCNELHRGTEEVIVDNAAAGRIARHGDDRHARRIAAEHLDGFERVHLGHEDIDDDEVEGESLDRFDGDMAAFGHHDAITLPPQQRGERIAHGLF